MANIQPTPSTPPATNVYSKKVSDARTSTPSPEAIESSEPEPSKLNPDNYDSPKCDPHGVPRQATAMPPASNTITGNDDVPGLALPASIVDDNIPQPTPSSVTFSQLPCSTEEFDFAMANLKNIRDPESVDPAELRHLGEQAIASIDASSAGEPQQRDQRIDRLTLFIKTCREAMVASLNKDLELARLRPGSAVAPYIDAITRDGTDSSISGIRSAITPTMGSTSNVLTNRTDATYSDLQAAPTPNTDDVTHPEEAGPASVMAEYMTMSPLESLPRWRSMLEGFVEQARARNSPHDQLAFGIMLEMVRLRELILEPDTVPGHQQPASPMSSSPSRDEFLAASLVPAPELEGSGECPICTDPFEKAVRTPCGHEFCAACLTRWLRDNATCPIDRIELFQPCQTSPATDTPNGPEDDDDDDDEFDELEYIFDELCIEPFSDQRDFAFHFHNEDVVEVIEAFDHYVDARSEQNEPFPEDTKVENAASTLRIVALGAIYRLASNRSTNSNLMARSMVHGMCRREWIEVMHCVSRFLTDVAIDIDINGEPIMNHMTAHEFERRLTSELAMYPRWDHRDTHPPDWVIQRFGDDREITRFEADKELLVKWIVWSAVKMEEVFDELTGLVVNCWPQEVDGEEDDDLPALV